MVRVEEDGYNGSAERSNICQDMSTVLHIHRGVTGVVSSSMFTPVIMVKEKIQASAGC